MTIFPLDSVRNAVIRPGIEPLLESVRAEVVASRFEDQDRIGDVSDVLEAFDASRPRLNVIASMTSDLRGRYGADISSGLGFVAVVLRRMGLNVITTEHDPGIDLFAHAGERFCRTQLGRRHRRLPPGRSIFSSSPRCSNISIFPPCVLSPNWPRS